MTPIRIKLRELREAKGLTQYELGELAGVRQAAISQLESGRRQRIDLDVIERLCTALGVDALGDMLELEREPKRGRQG